MITDHNNVDVEVNNIIIMDAIMTRDQRTTTHRVLNREIGLINNNNNNNNNNNSNNNNNNNNNNNSNTNTDVNMPRKLERINSIVDLCHQSRVNDHKLHYNHSNIGICNRTGNSIDLINRMRFSESNRAIHNFYWELKRLTSTNKCSRTNITTWLRLGSLLILLLVVSVQGAPTSMALESRRLSQPPKWVNPCGLAAEDIDGSLDVEQLRDEQLLAQVVVQAKTALDHAQLFCDDYIKRTFNTDFNYLHTTWKKSHYDWLPKFPDDIPKQLGEPLKDEYLNQLEVRMLDTALLNAYEYMQRYAVGLEQIVWDQEDHRLEFLKQFKDTEYKLRTVLCELQVALMERGVTPRADITREAMPTDYRIMSKSVTYRNLRDWLIFRDYMNGLEYVVQVFEHLKRNLES